MIAPLTIIAVLVILFLIQISYRLLTLSTGASLHPLSHAAEGNQAEDTKLKNGYGEPVYYFNNQWD